MKRKNNEMMHFIRQERTRHIFQVWTYQQEDMLSEEALRELLAKEKEALCIVNKQSMVQCIYQGIKACYLRSQEDRQLLVSLPARRGQEKQVRGPALTRSPPCVLYPLKLPPAPRPPPVEYKDSA